MITVFLRPEGFNTYSMNSSKSLRCPAEINFANSQEKQEAQNCANQHERHKDEMRDLASSDAHSLEAEFEGDVGQFEYNVKANKD